MLSITSSTVTMSAMRQSDNYGANLQQLYDPDLKDRLAKAHDILDVDRIAALVDGTKRNQTKINDKKRLLDNLRLQRRKILEDAQQLDVVLGTDMDPTLTRLIPSEKTQITKRNNNELANLLVYLREPLQVFMTKYTEQKQLNNEGRRTRGSTSAQEFGCNEGEFTYQQ